MRFAGRLRFVFVALFLWSAWVAQAAPITFRAYEDARDSVEFTSKAPLEKIVGKARKTRGIVTVENLADLLKNKIEARFEVDLATVDTGLALRDQHMRDNYLETGKYPVAVFTLTKIEQAQTVTKTPQGQEVAKDVKGLEPNVKTRITALGTFDLHGVKRDIRLTDLTVTYVVETEETKKSSRPGNLLRIEGSFPVKLSDYRITRPQLMILRLSDDALVTLDITAGTGVKGGPMVSDPKDVKKP